jgi:hypothetical protein
VSITTDKLGSYPKALRRLKRKGELKDTVQHRTSITRPFDDVPITDSR